MTFAPLEVDVIGWLQDRLAAAMTQRVLTELPADLAAVVNARGGVIQLVRAGGGDDGLVVDEPRIVTHCFAATPKAANDLAYAVGSAYRNMVGLAVDGAVLQSVRTAGGPVPNNYPNTSVREVVRIDEHRIKSTFQ